MEEAVRSRILPKLQNSAQFVLGHPKSPSPGLYAVDDKSVTLQK